MKGIIISVMIFLMAGKAMANPIADILIGGIMIGTGGYFEFQRSNAKSDRQTAETETAKHFILTIKNDENAQYYYGAAEWERLNFGNTAIWVALRNTANNYNSVALSEASLTSTSANTASDFQDKQNLYKGISLTAFGVGSAFIIKGAIEYLIERNATKSVKLDPKYKWVKNIDLMPNQNANGVKLIYAYTF